MARGRGQNQGRRARGGGRSRGRGRGRGQELGQAQVETQAEAQSLAVDSQAQPVAATTPAAQASGPGGEPHDPESNAGSTAAAASAPIEYRVEIERHRLRKLVPLYEGKKILFFREDNRIWIKLADLNKAASSVQLHPTHIPQHIRDSLRKTNSGGMGNLAGGERTLSSEDVSSPAMYWIDRETAVAIPGMPHGLVQYLMSIEAGEARSAQGAPSTVPEYRVEVERDRLRKLVPLYQEKKILFFREDDRIWIKLADLNKAAYGVPLYPARVPQHIRNSLRRTNAGGNPNLAGGERTLSSEDVSSPVMFWIDRDTAVAYPGMPHDLVQYLMSIEAGEARSAQEAPSTVPEYRVEVERHRLRKLVPLYKEKKILFFREDDRIWIKLADLNRAASGVSLHPTYVPQHIRDSLRKTNSGGMGNLAGGERTLSNEDVSSQVMFWIDRDTAVAIAGMPPDLVQYLMSIEAGEARSAQEGPTTHQIGYLPSTDPLDEQTLVAHLKKVADAGVATFASSASGVGLVNDKSIAQLRDAIAEGQLNLLDNTAMYGPLQKLAEILQLAKEDPRWTPPPAAHPALLVPAAAEGNRPSLCGFFRLGDDKQPRMACMVCGTSVEGLRNLGTHYRSRHGLLRNEVPKIMGHFDCIFIDLTNPSNQTVKYGRHAWGESASIPSQGSRSEKPDAWEADDLIFWYIIDHTHPHNPIFASLIFLLNNRAHFDVSDEAYASAELILRSHDLGVRLLAGGEFASGGHRGLGGLSSQNLNKWLRSVPSLFDLIATVPDSGRLMTLSLRHTYHTTSRLIGINLYNDDEEKVNSGDFWNVVYAPLLPADFQCSTPPIVSELCPTGACVVFVVRRTRPAGCEIIDSYGRRYRFPRSCMRMLERYLASLVDHRRPILAAHLGIDPAAMDSRILFLDGLPTDSKTFPGLPDIDNIEGLVLPQGWRYITLSELRSSRGVINGLPVHLALSRWDGFLSLSAALIDFFRDWTHGVLSVLYDNRQLRGVPNWANTGLHHIAIYSIVRLREYLILLDLQKQYDEHAYFLHNESAAAAEAQKRYYRLRMENLQASMQQYQPIDPAEARHFGDLLANFTFELGRRRVLASLRNVAGAESSADEAFDLVEAEWDNEMYAYAIEWDDNAEGDDAGLAGEIDEAEEAEESDMELYGEEEELYDDDEELEDEEFDGEDGELEGQNADDYAGLAS